MYILTTSQIWDKILYQVSLLFKKEPILSDFYYNNIIQHQNFISSLNYILSNKLSTSMISANKIKGVFDDVCVNNPSILNFIAQDIQAILQRDPAVHDYLTPLLYLKGFHALEAYRMSHYLWNTGEKSLSFYLQSRISSEFSVDIHPAASIGSGVMLDHATGIVIGESVIIEENVSIFHSVTLGGTGKKFSKNRHPTIREGVIIGAGAKILGNIEVGSQSKVGAGSIVLKNVPSNVTVVGIPAKIVNQLDSQRYFSQDKKDNAQYVNRFQNGDGI